MFYLGKRPHVGQGVPEMPPLSSIQLETLRTRLALYLAAEKAVLEGNQEYSIEGMTFRRADLKVIRDTIEQIRLQIAAVEKRGGLGINSWQVVF